MKELSLNILDLIENSVAAKASKVFLNIEESEKYFYLELNDDGAGMLEEEVSQVLNPFFSTKGKKVGLGLPFIKEIADMCGGKLEVNSIKGKGTNIKLQLPKGCIDLPPLGNITSTLVSIVALHPDLDLIYNHSFAGNAFTFSLNDFKVSLEDVPVNHPQVLKFLEEYLKEQLIKLSGGIPNEIFGRFKEA